MELEWKIVLEYFRLYLNEIVLHCFLILYCRTGMGVDVMMMEFVRKNFSVQFVIFIIILEQLLEAFAEMTGLMYFTPFYLTKKPTCPIIKVIQVQ